MAIIHQIIKGSGYCFSFLNPVAASWGLLSVVLQCYINSWFVAFIGVCFKFRKVRGQNWVVTGLLLRGSTDFSWWQLKLRLEVQYLTLIWSLVFDDSLFWALDFWMSQGAENILNWLWVCAFYIHILIGPLVFETCMFRSLAFTMNLKAQRTSMFWSPEFGLWRTIIRPCLV